MLHIFTTGTLLMHKPIEWVTGESLTLVSYSNRKSNRNRISDKTDKEPCKATFVVGGGGGKGV